MAILTMPGAGGSQQGLHRRVTLPPHRKQRTSDARALTLTLTRTRTPTPTLTQALTLTLTLTQVRQMLEPFGPMSSFNLIKARPPSHERAPLTRLAYTPVRPRYRIRAPLSPPSLHTLTLSRPYTLSLP